MSTVVIPCFPDCEITIASAVLGIDESPEMVVYQKLNCTDMFPSYKGELSYEMIKENILLCHTPFYANATGGNVIRIIVPVNSFYEIMKTNTYLKEENVVTLTTGFPKWVINTAWYKQDSRNKVDAVTKRTRNNKTTQKGSKQQRGVPNDPPSREGDAVFWK